MDIESARTSLADAGYVSRGRSDYWLNGSMQPAERFSLTIDARRAWRQDVLLFDNGHVSVNQQLGATSPAVPLYVQVPADLAAFEQAIARPALPRPTPAGVATTPEADPVPEADPFPYTIEPAPDAAAQD